MKGLGHAPRALLGAVGHQDRAGALLHQMPRGQFAHLARAHQENRASLQRAEDLARQFHGHRGDGDGVRADLGLRANLLGGGKGALQQVLELAAHGARGARHGEGLLHLAQNLRLAHHHGVQAGGHAEEMAHGFLVAMLVEVRRQQRGVQAEVALQKAGQIGASGDFHGSQQLHAVAGGDDHALGHAGHGGQGAGGLRQLFAGDGDALAQLDGRGLVVHSDEGQGHWGPNLWTWLKRLAAQTAIITRKTAPER